MSKPDETIRVLERLRRQFSAKRRLWISRAKDTRSDPHSRCRKVGIGNGMMIAEAAIRAMIRKLKEAK